jgi:hypothetical protein
VKLTEDHRSDLVVIVAGFGPPRKAFPPGHPRPGVEVPKTIDLPDYTDDELAAVFWQMAEAAGTCWPKAPSRRSVSPPHPPETRSAAMVAALVWRLLAANRVRGPVNPSEGDPVDGRPT